MAVLIQLDKSRTKPWFLRTLALLLMVGIILTMLGAGILLGLIGFSVLTGHPDPFKNLRLPVLGAGLLAAGLAHTQFNRSNSFVNKMLFRDTG